MGEVKQITLLILRLALACIVMSIAYNLSTLLIWQANTPISLTDIVWPERAVFPVATISALVLSYPILRSPWHGLNLIGGIFIVQFGVETFMTQIETLYFNRAIQVNSPELINIVAAGALRALIFAPLAVLIFGKWKKSNQTEKNLVAVSLPRWVTRYLALAVLYAIVYFMFGYYVAWQWQELRLFYSGSTAILPLFTHLQGYFSIGQVVEGVLAARAVRQVAQQHGVVMPIAEHVYRVLYEGLPPRDAVVALMTRRIKVETA